MRKLLSVLERALKVVCCLVCDYFKAHVSYPPFLWMLTVMTVKRQSLKILRRKVGRACSVSRRIAFQVVMGWVSSLLLQTQGMEAWQVVQEGQELGMISLTLLLQEINLFLSIKHVRVDEALRVGVEEEEPRRCQKLGFEGCEESLYDGRCCQHPVLFTDTVEERRESRVSLS